MRTKIHITPRDMGKWAVKVEGNSRASRTYGKKTKAVRKGRKKAKKMARKKGATELLIHKANGKIQKKHSYGSDTRRYSG